MITAKTMSSETWRNLLDVRNGGALAEATALDPISSVYLPIAGRSGCPMVIAQVGQSLDGRVATVDGDARDLSGHDGFLHLHRLRALVDAVVIGVGSVIADDPQLTVRNVDGPDPVRVVIDPNGRIPNGCKLLAPPGTCSARTVVVQADDRFPRDDVETIGLARSAEGRLEPSEIVSALQEKGLAKLLIEGGGKTIGHFLRDGLVDRLHICVAPVIIGSGLAGVNLPVIQTLSEGLRPNVMSYDLGTDVLFDCDFVNHIRHDQVARDERGVASTSSHTKSPGPQA